MQDIIRLGEMIRSKLDGRCLLALRESMEELIRGNWDRLIRPIIEDETLTTGLTNPKKYQRHIIFWCEQFEIVMIAWLPSQQTSIHGHPSGGCLFRVLDGRLSEELFPEGGSSVSNTYTNNDAFGYIDDRAGKHRVECTSDRPTLSLHIYSPPFSTPL